MEKIGAIAMKNIGTILKEKRKALDLSMSEISAIINIDQGLISRIERGVRIPTEAQLVTFADLYQMEISSLRKHWLADKIVKAVYGYKEAPEAFLIAEPRIEYLSSKNVLKPIELSKSIKTRLKEIDKLHRKWKSKKPLDGLRLRKMREYFTINYTHESNKIEGNTLTLQETHLVVNEGITISGKSMEEHLEAINHVEASEMLYEIVSDSVVFDERTLLDLHNIILRGINKRYAGCYRDVPVKISGSTHEPAQPYLIAKMMEDYFINYKNHIDVLHPVILAAEMHERLVSIHPFIDGNGRTARLIMNLVLLSNGYTIANLKGDITNRLKYYKALENVQQDNEPDHFYHLIIDSIEESLLSHIELAS
ncbi:MAG: Fic family protein [Saprospiraceae bacterium]